MRWCRLPAPSPSAWLASYVWLTSRAQARRQKVFEGQLPLALDIVTRALRAGHPVVSAVQLAAEEMGDPIGSEFGLIVDETSYGLEFKDALLNFARRTGSPDAHYFAVSVGIQSETGGNLAEILTNLADVIRDRQSLTSAREGASQRGKDVGSDTQRVADSAHWVVSFHRADILHEQIQRSGFLAAW